jgi:hypothetical protein
VLFKTTVVAIVALVIGILVLTVAGQYVTMTVQNTQRTDVEPHAEFIVGDVVERSYSLPASVSVFGTIKVTDAPTNKSSDIRFLVFDDENYQQWSAGGQANSLYSDQKQGQFNYTFTTVASGTHHFVFDNRASIYKKYVVFSLAYNEIVTSQVPDPRAQYVAWAMIAIGAILLVIGIIKKPPVRWSN